LGCFLTDITRTDQESPAMTLVIATTIVATVPLLV